MHRVTCYLNRGSKYCTFCEEIWDGPGTGSWTGVPKAVIREIRRERFYTEEPANRVVVLHYIQDPPRARDNSVLPCEPKTIIHRRIIESVYTNKDMVSLIEVIL